MLTPNENRVGAQLTTTVPNTSKKLARVSKCLAVQMESVHLRYYGDFHTKPDRIMSIKKLDSNEERYYARYDFTFD